MNILNKDLIVLGADVKTSEEAIQLSSGLFEKYGYVNDQYCQSVINREKQYPTGLPAKGMGVAIPHTTNEHVLKPTIGVIIPNEPVEFRMMGSDDEYLYCEIIIPLVIKDTEKQMSLLKYILKVLQDNDKLNRIKNAKTEEEVLEQFSELNNGEFL